MDGAEEVAKQIEAIIGEQPERAARLFEVFIAACHEKAEEIDDSGGSFGLLIDDLFHGWIKARQAAGAYPDETADSLLSWMEDDPYGFCYDLDREAAKVLDKRGLEAFARRIRSKFESALANKKKDRLSEQAARKWGGALKNLLAAQGRVEEYLTLCLQTDLRAEDCKAIAEMYQGRRRPEEVLAWVEHGLELASSDKWSMDGHDLQELKRASLAKLGRAADALESAWSEFLEEPSLFTYRELVRYVPAQEKTAWHNKAMEASEQGDLGSHIELCLEKKEINRLVSRLHRTTDDELEGLSHFTTGPLARKLHRSHPDVAARVYRALSLRIINAGKSKYYDTALENLKLAKKCYAKGGLDTDWEALVAQVRERHARKRGFMAGFEEIVAGKTKKAAPSFLERARARSRFRKSP